MTPVSNRCAVIGAGRVGSAMIAALNRAGIAVDGPYRRGQAPDLRAVEIVLLCVPDEQIATACANLGSRSDDDDGDRGDELLVVHCSGMTTLAPLLPNRAASLHPLMTITGAETDLNAVPAAVAGSDKAALAQITALARALGMRPFKVDDADRAAYHAAACIASNFLITLEAAAESVGRIDRALLAPLVQATVDNWQRLGPHAALTGPIARGDTATVARQRAAIAARAPQLSELFDLLAAATDRLVAERDRRPTPGESAR